MLGNEEHASQDTLPSRDEGGRFVVIIGTPTVEPEAIVGGEGGVGPGATAARRPHAAGRPSDRPRSANGRGRRHRRDRRELCNPCAAPTCLLACWR
ncbi:MAG: hypothetical protein M0C28_31065 [Candidatus Moduliflexus flocculans]|nr:hypothetical protein [Candidatus Moduliflexus flocculans]